VGRAVPALREDHGLAPLFSLLLESHVPVQARLLFVATHACVVVVAHGSRLSHGLVGAEDFTGLLSGVWHPRS
jgi:hypothetical protein